MENNTQQTATGQLAGLHWQQKEGTFSLWDALDLAFEENHPPDILKSLLKTFSGLDADMQVAALRKLGETGRLLSDNLKKGVIYYFLAKHLEDSHAEVRTTAVEAISMLARQTLAGTLALKLVSDESTSVRIASAEALGELIESIALHAFKESLSNPNWEVRAATIQTLGKLGERLIIEPLQTALEDQDFSVRSATLHVLGTFKGCLSTKYLVSLAKEQTKDWVTRDAAVTALERAGDYAWTKSLRASLDRALETEVDFMEHDEQTQESTQQSKKGFLPWSIWGNKVACVSNQLRKYGEGILSRSKEGLVGFLLLFLTIGGFFDSTLHFYASHHLREHGKVVFSHGRGIIPVILLILCLAVPGIVGFSLGSSHASGISTAHSSKQFSVVSPSLTPTMDIPTQQDNALLAVIAQPESVAPGKTFSITIAATNYAMTARTGDYQLACSSKDPQGVGCMGVDKIYSPAVPRNSGTCTFVVQLIAPQSTGTYASQWTMSRDGIQFGNSLPIEVHVS